MEQKLKTLNDYIKDEIANIKNDRAVTSNLLSDLMIEIKNLATRMIHIEI